MSLRTVFYGRVSTNEAEQLQSLNSQIEYFTKYIDQNEDWVFTGQYIDEGLSGTSTKKRKSFLQMLQDAKDHKFDLILTREVSRFARNTVDTLQYTRDLKSYNVGVIFTLDNIDTRDKDGELRLSIMASLAQEEARKTSNNVKWKQEHLMRQGVVFGNNNILGYQIVNKKLVINPEQAETIRLIYKLYLEGWGYRKIQRELIDRELKTATGRFNWKFTVIRNVLLNEKYTGKLVQKKYKTIDYLDKIRIKNKDTEEFIIIENNHDPIVSEEEFQAVQLEMTRRFALGRNGQKYETRHVLSSKIQCGICGKNLTRNLWNRNLDGTRTYGWKCSLARDIGKQLQNNQGCDAKGVAENTINKALDELFIMLYQRRHSIIKILSMVMEKSLGDISLETDITKANGIVKKYLDKIDNLMELSTDKMITKAEFHKKKTEYEDIINEQQNVLDKFNNLDKEKLTVKNRIEDIKVLLENMSDLTKTDKLIDNFIDHIVIFNKNKIEIYLKSDTKFSFIDGNIIMEGQKHYVNSVCPTQSSKQNTVPIFYFYMPLSDCSKTKVETFMVF